MYKRLDNGAFRWSRSADEAMSITKDQYRMLMQGFEIVAQYPIEELKETPSIMWFVQNAENKKAKKISEQMMSTNRQTRQDASAKSWFV